MVTIFLLGNEVVALNVAEVELAKESCLALAPHVGESTLCVQVKNGTRVELPSSVARLLLGILTEMGRGNAVVVSPIQAELTTNQAAEILNVSRPYLMKLLEEEAMQFRKVGSHHRLLLRDVLAYKKEMYARQLAGMDELTALSQELGLYDDPMK